MGKYTCFIHNSNLCKFFLLKINDLHFYTQKCD
nr:MAG TPA: hypothetical protein [Caudoviricetes sp.]